MLKDLQTWRALWHMTSTARKKFIFVRMPKALASLMTIEKL